MIPNPYPRGKFIAFEGLDGGGKSTQHSLIAKAIQSAEDMVPVSTKEPNVNLPSGRLIYALLAGKHRITFSGMTQAERQRYYFINRLEHYEKVVIPALAAGWHVLSDRSLASVALDVERQGDLEALLTDEEEIFSMAKVPFIMPDLILIYDVPAEIALARLKEKGRELDFFEQAAFKISQTRRAYKRFAEQFPDFCQIIDGSPDVAAVFAATKAAIMDRFGFSF